MLDSIRQYKVTSYVIHLDKGSGKISFSSTSLSFVNKDVTASYAQHCRSPLWKFGY